MRLLKLYFSTENHGEVMVKIKNPPKDLTPAKAKTLAQSLIPTYRTRKKGIPLKEFRRAVLITKDQDKL